MPIANRRTHCKRGHPLSGENLYTRPNGYRMCRACGRIWHREHPTSPRSLAYWRRYHRWYRAKHYEHLREYNRRHMAEKRRMLRLLEAIAYQVTPIEPVGLPGNAPLSNGNAPGASPTPRNGGNGGSGDAEGLERL
jgi:hypothetical protein